MKLKPIKFSISGWTWEGYPIILELKDSEKDHWSFVCGAFVFNKNSNWEWEPRDSFVSETFKERTRFSFEQAMIIIENYCK